MSLLLFLNSKVNTVITDQMFRYNFAIKVYVLIRISSVFFLTLAFFSWRLDLTIKKPHNYLCISKHVLFMSA